MSWRVDDSVEREAKLVVREKGTHKPPQMLAKYLCDMIK